MPSYLLFCFLYFNAWCITCAYSVLSIQCLGTTQISSFFTKHWTKFLTHQTGDFWLLVLMILLNLSYSSTAVSQLFCLLWRHLNPEKMSRFGVPFPSFGVLVWPGVLGPKTANSRCRSASRRAKRAATPAAILFIDLNAVFLRKNLTEKFKRHGAVLQK